MLKTLFFTMRMKKARPHSPRAFFLWGKEDPKIQRPKDPKEKDPRMAVNEVITRE